MKLPRYMVALSVVGTAAGAVVLFKDATGGVQFTGNERIPGRTVIVTGASSGIGKEIATELANRGARVVLACRNMSQCEAVRSEIVDRTYNKSVQCHELDLASLKSVRKFAQVINDSEQRVDVLVNNAGVLQTERSVTKDGFETHLGVNYLGHFLLTRLLLDKLSESGGGRIINTVGVGYNRTHLNFTDFNNEQSYKYDHAYNRSKLAMMMFSIELAQRVHGLSVTVVSVHPPVAFTKLRDSVLKRGRWIKPLWQVTLRTPVQAAQCSIFCALSSDIVNGKSYAQCRETEIDPIALDKDELKRLWLISERWTMDIEAS